MAENSRTKYAMLNVLFGYSSQFISLILSFISRTVFLYVLSVDYLGINGLFTDILQMLSLADLGFNTAMTYSFYKPLAENNKLKIIQLISFYKKIYSIIAMVITVIGIAIIPFLKYIINVEDEIPLLNVYYLFALAGVVVSYLFVYKTTLLTASQKNYVVVKVSIITNILKTIVQVIALLFFRNYIVYLAVALFFTFINNYFASRCAVKEYPYLNEKVQQLNLDEKKEIFQNLKSVFIYKIAGLLLNATDNTFISVLVNTAAVGYYSNYLMINNKVSSVLSTVFNALTASIGNIIVTEREEKRYIVFQGLQYVNYIVCGIIIASYLALINDFVFVWLGSDYLFDNITVFAIALNLYFACILQPLWSYREATGLYKKTKYIMLITAILNIVLSLLWGKAFGIKGIIFASIVSRLVTYMWYEPFLLFKEYFNKPVKKYFGGIVFNFILIILDVFIIECLFRKLCVDTWFKLIFKLLVIFLYNIVFFVLIYRRSEGFKIIENKIRMIFKLKTESHCS